MLMIKGDPQPGAAPSEELLAAMGRYNDDLKAAGVLVDLAGLLPSAEGRRVKFSGGNRTVVEGPFAESKQLVAGYWILQVRSMEEAVEWAVRVLLDRHRRRGPLPLGHHRVAVGLGHHLLLVGQHVGVRDREPARVGPDRLVLRQRDGDDPVAVLPPALAQDPHGIRGGRALVAAFDALVDLPGHRLVGGGAFLPAAHLPSPNRDVTTPPPGPSTVPRSPAHGSFPPAGRHHAFVKQADIRRSRQGW